MKRIVIYGINYAPEPIGVGRYSSDIGDYLARQGVQVEVITAVPHYPGWAVRDNYRNRYSVEQKSGVRITRCPLILRSDVRGFWRLVAPLSFAITSAPVALWRIFHTRPDVVLCIEPTILAAPAALLGAKFVGARSVLHVQDLEIDAAFAVNHLRGNTLRRCALWFEKIILRAFDQVITISNRMAEKLVAKGLPERKVGLVRNWVDLEKLRPLSDVSQFRMELGFPAGKFIALYAGNMGPKQALPIVMEAAKLLVHEPNIMFVLAGEGPEKKRLREQFGDLPNIRFLPIQPEERLCELLSLASIHLLPQDRGAADLVLPSKLGGMLASGRPCVVMADAGTELYEFLSGSAVLLPPGDAAALAAVIATICHRTVNPPINLQRAEVFDARNNLAVFKALLGAAQPSG